MKEYTFPVDSCRPLVTYALFTYNQEQYVRASIEAAFSQTYSPLEIIISDDASSDRTFAIIQEMVEAYQGPHEVRLNQNPSNLGVVGNVNGVLGMVTTDLLIVAAGDDISMPERTDVLVALFEETGCSAACSAAETINENGECTGTFGQFPYQLLKSKGLVHKMPPFYGAAGAYSMEIVRRHGFVPANIRNEDINLMWKAFFCNGIAYSKESLLKYRIHTQNLSIGIKIKNATSCLDAKRHKLEKYENYYKNHKHILKIADLRGIPYLCYLMLIAKLRKFKVLLLD